MLFGVKANVGSNPTVTANEKGPASLVNKGKQGLLLGAPDASNNAAVTNFCLVRTPTGVDRRLMLALLKCRQRT